MASSAPRTLKPHAVPFTPGGGTGSGSVTPLPPADSPATVASSPAERVLWIDIEMTDVRDTHAGRIMEIGAIVATKLTEPVPHAAYHRVVRLTEGELAGSSAWSAQMHSQPCRRGRSLMQLCTDSPFELAEIERDLLELANTHRGDQLIMIAGSSIASDRAFINEHMPKFAAVLHHRMLDVSTLLEMARRLYPGIRNIMPQPRVSHCAMDDIVSSLELMQFFQHNLLTPIIPLDLGPQRTFNSDRMIIKRTYPVSNIDRTLRLSRNHNEFARFGSIPRAHLSGPHSAAARSPTGDGHTPPRAPSPCDFESHTAGGGGRHQHSRGPGNAHEAARQLPAAAGDRGPA